MGKSKKITTNLVGKISFAKEFVKSKLKKNADKSPDNVYGGKPSEEENTSQFDATDITGPINKKPSPETTPIHEDTNETSESSKKKSG